MVTITVIDSSATIITNTVKNIEQIVSFLYSINYSQISQIIFNGKYFVSSHDLIAIKGAFGQKSLLKHILENIELEEMDEYD